MNANATAATRLESTSDPQQSHGGLNLTALTTILMLLTFGGISLAWAGDQNKITTGSPYLHLTGVSLHIGWGVLHLGEHHHPYRGYRPVRHHHYRHGHRHGHAHHYSGYRHNTRRDHHYGPQYRGRDRHQGRHQARQAYQGNRRNRH